MQPHVTRIQVRWTDIDTLGHVTHSVVFAYLDEARDELLRSLVGDVEAWPNVVAHAAADFRRELPRSLREVFVRTRIVEVGRSSVRFEQEILGPDGEAAVEAKAVLVAWDPVERRARAIGDDERGRLAGG